MPWNLWNGREVPCQRACFCQESNAFFCDHPTGRRLSNQTALQAQEPESKREQKRNPSFREEAATQLVKNAGISVCLAENES